MVIEICECILIGLLIVFVAYQSRKIDRLYQKMAVLALKIKEAEDLSNRVDNSVGIAINDLRRDMAEFKDVYGEATVEEIKESAKAQKAFADGLNSIMQFGAGLYDRGDSA